MASRLERNNSLALYSHMSTGPGPISNGSSKTEVVILEPSTTTSVAREFISMLHKSLRYKDYTVFTKYWAEGIAAEDVKGRITLSLLELEQPFLDKLSKFDFDGVKMVVLNSEKLFWITAGDDPALEIVDGFARCMMSENVGIKFQLLHLSKETGLRYGPSLASRILESDSIDNEYGEVDGVLQIARIFKSYSQSESIRHHLEDSTRIETIVTQGEALQLIIGKPGLLDTLKFVSDERMISPLEDHEVEIQVKATGLK